MRFTISREPPMRAAISCWGDARAPRACPFARSRFSSMNLGETGPVDVLQGEVENLLREAAHLADQHGSGGGDAGLRSSSPHVAARNHEKRHGSRVMIEAERGPPSEHQLAEVVAHADVLSTTSLLLLAHERLDASERQDLQGVVSSPR